MTAKRETKQLKVAGVTYANRQWLLAYIKKQNPKSLFVTFAREKNNKYDEYAVVVVVHCRDTNKHIPIGYVPRAISKEIAERIEKTGKVWTTDCVITGGGKGRNYGCTITYEW